MINPKTYIPRLGSRIRQVLELMNDGRERSRDEICVALGLQRIEYRRTIYVADLACVDCKISYHSYAHLKESGTPIFAYSGASQLFIRMTGGDDYQRLGPMLQRVARGRYRISALGCAALKRARQQ